MATRRCPKCGLINPGSTTTCDCGWSFVDETMGKPRHIPRPGDAGRREAPPGGGVELAIGAGLLVLGIVVTAVTYGSASAAGGGTYIIAYGPIGVGLGTMIRGLIKKNR